MAKKALGKGLKDLLPGSGADDKKSPKNMEMQQKKAQLQMMVDEYREQGYIVTKLSKSLKKDVPAMKEAEKEFKDGLKKLEKARELLKEVDLSTLGDAGKVIEEILKDPYKADELLEHLSKLEDLMIDAQDQELQQKEEKMDAWIQDQKKVMIDLMGIYKERASEEGAPEAPEEGATSEEGGEPGELRAKLEEWKAKGYLITRLESILMDDINQAKEEFAAFEENIDKINRLGKRLDNLNTEGYEAKVRLIKTKLNYPNLANEVEKEIIKLETKILGAPVEEPPATAEEVTPEDAPAAEKAEAGPAAEEVAPEEPAPAGDGEEPTPPGDEEEPTSPGDEEKPTPPGDEEKPTPPGDEEEPTPPGDEEEPTPPGDEEEPTPPRDEEEPTPAGEGEEPEPVGEEPAPEGEEPAPVGEGEPQPDTPQEGEQPPQEEGTEGGGDLFDPEAILKEMEGGEGGEPAAEEEQQEPEGEGEEAPPQAETDGEAPPEEEGAAADTPEEGAGEEAPPQEETTDAEQPQEEAPAEEPAKPTGDNGDSPDDLPQLLQTAQDAYRERDFPKAVEYFDKVLALDPENSNAIFMRKRAASKL